MSELLPHHPEGTEPGPAHLPSVGEISSDFEYLLSRNGNTIMRLRDAVDYSEHLRALAATRTTETITLKEAKDQNLSKLFVNAISIIAKQQSYRTVSSKSTPHSERFSNLKDLLANKRELQGHIEEFTLLNYDADSSELYETLNGLVLQARRLIYDELDSSGKPSWGNSGLLGVLAESKVVNALRSHEWPHANHSSIDQDINGVDVVVPKSESDAVGLQVKCVPKDKVPLKIVSTRIPTIFVPMNPAQNDPFRMSEVDAVAVSSYLHQAPILPQILAA